MIILATIPVGLVGVAFEHTFRVLFAKPILAGIFLMVNGLILLAGERYRTRASLAADASVAAERDQAGFEPAARQPAMRTSPVPEMTVTQPTVREPAWLQPAVPAEPELAEHGRARPAPATHRRQQPGLALRDADVADARRADRRLAGMTYPQAVIIGSAQILALLAGISRDGVTMVAGLSRGLSREDAARFAFLLATPVILAAGALKLPDLVGPLGNGIRGQILLGSVLSGVGAYLAVRFLLKYLRTRTLTPFGIYCLVAGLASVVYLGLVR
jgi:undecaprenyl-diphosphatase